MRFIRLWVISTLLLLLTGCEKTPSHVLVPVSLSAPATITPSSRIINRGDTLWLEANFSDSLLDLNSGHRYRVRPQDLKWSSSIVYKELLGVDKEPAGIAPTFHLVEKVGRASIDGAFTGSFAPIYDGNYYRVRIGLIPTKACITALSMLIKAGSTDLSNPLLPFIQLLPDAQGREQKAELENFSYAINGGKANNFDLFSQHRRAFSLEPGTPTIQILYEQQSTFTVEVK